MTELGMIAAAKAHIETTLQEFAGRQNPRNNISGPRVLPDHSRQDVGIFGITIAMSPLQWAVVVTVVDREGVRRDARIESVTSELTVEQIKVDAERLVRAAFQLSQSCYPRTKAAA